MTDRELIDTIFSAGLAAVDPLVTLPPHLVQVKEMFRTGGFRRLIVVGFGKASVPMALAVEDMLDQQIGAGLIIAPHGANLSALPRRIKVATAGHPHPDPAGVVASRRIIELAHAADEKTLMLLLISGGGSALFTAPADEITLEEKMETCRLLMDAGADIQELNTVRKHLSKVKGGKLAALAHPARIFALAVSDVPGDRPDVIASGPAYPDPTTFADALAVLARLHLSGRVPPAVRKRLELGAAGSIKETPKPGDPLFSSVTTVIAARNRDAMEAAAHAAGKHKMEVHLLESPICGEAREAGRRLAELAVARRRKLAPGQLACLISGGETTVRVVGKGKGGRNQEMAVAFAMAIEGEPGITFLSGGTDGIDGPTDAAGGVVDGNTVALARAAGLDPVAYLAENDAYAFLQGCRGLLKTGPTGTNVMDLQIAVVRG
ncbi:glycerate kinase [Geomonas sp.]|uniref:glycerate kinase type-2 family protein n=1 Tax=Geomonas sp. TaxID=2651584 RepID=UPI002B48ECDC|nr:glycerate kinase [Geomonas sp.]HJV34906.1 glycerate kinase [Geomonas sp.]